MTKRTPVPAEFQTVDGPTEPQRKFLIALLNERDLRGDKIPADISDDDYKTVVADMVSKIDSLSKRDASRWIERLLTLRQLPRERAVTRAGNEAIVPSGDELPTGHYAVEAESGELRFYRLWRGTRNPNYVKLYVEHGPDDSEIHFKSALVIIEKIMKAGARECALRYGQEIGACSQCGRRLTNRVSRLLSIGPVCGGRFWEEDSWAAIKRTARRELTDAGLDPDADVDDSDNFDYHAAADLAYGN